MNQMLTVILQILLLPHLVMKELSENQSSDKRAIKERIAEKGNSAHNLRIAERRVRFDL